jgi:HlyD family secretion protein
MKIPTRFSPLRSAFLVLFLLALAYAAWHFLAADNAPQYKLDNIETGPITAAVSATGTLNPVVSVQVGSQVSGQIKEIFADFNSPVKTGQLIARIDPETYRQRVIQAQADAEAARANLAMQRAEVARVEANWLDAQRNDARKQSLLEKNFISAADRDTAQTALSAAAASLKLARAQVQGSIAQVRQREALLAQAQVDLGRTEIRSPVDGVVVKRSVDTGQTVAASLQAPELFIIAKNLKDMQVETAVDEADVGRIQPGQDVSFTVDAFPGQHFSGKVTQVRKAATIVSNVVSYVVVVSAANPDLILLPGMTANVRIVTAHKDNALKVANAALRFRPANQKGAKTGENRDKKPAKGTSNAVPPAPTILDKKPGIPGHLWVLDKDGNPQAVDVRLGLSDGSMTEILGSRLTAGSQVITGMQSAGKTGQAKAMAGPRMF